MVTGFFLFTVLTPFFQLFSSWNVTRAKRAKDIIDNSKISDMVFDCLKKRMHIAYSLAIVIVVFIENKNCCSISFA